MFCIPIAASSDIPAKSSSKGQPDIRPLGNGGMDVYNPHSAVAWSSDGRAVVVEEN